MKRFLGVLVAAAVAVGASSAASESTADQSGPLRIFLRGGLKTHGPVGNGQHDGPSFVKEWTPLLEARGARVASALRFPTADELAATDVIVMFCANGGNIDGAEREYFEAFLRRGGGIVALHDAVLARDAHWFKTIIGGAWQNGVAKYYEGDNTYYYVNGEHPITKGASNFTIDDEVYWDLHMMPNAQILQAAMQPVRPARGAAPPPEPAIGRLIPQLWVYENQLPGGTPYRAVVSLLGHHFSTFSSPHARAVFLRAIAWAGGRDADSLATPDEITALK
jgi:type 1 glutamine amidotransferase